MLPGLRFLMLATILTCALLAFGLGAAAFLRATHDRFAAAPPWQAPREVIFAGQRANEAEATLSLLRIDTPPDTPQVLAEAGSAADIAATAPSVTPAAPAQPTISDEPDIATLFPPAPAPVERDVTADVLAALESPPLPSAEPATTPALTEIPAIASPAEPATEAHDNPASSRDDETSLPQQTAVLTQPEPTEPQEAETTASVPPVDPASTEIATTYGDEFAAEPIAHPPLPRPRPAMTHAARQNLAAAKQAREMQAAQRRQAAIRTRAPQQPQQQPAYLFPSLFGN